MAGRQGLWLSLLSLLPARADCLSLCCCLQITGLGKVPAQGRKQWKQEGRLQKVALLAQQRNLILAAGYHQPRLEEGLTPSLRPMKGTYVIKRLCVPTCKWIHVFEHKCECEHVYTGTMSTKQCALQPYVRREQPRGRDSWAADSPLAQEAVVTAAGPIPG